MLLIGLQVFQFQPFRQSCRSQIRVTEIATAARIFIKEQLAVRPFKVKCHPKGLTDFPVLEQRVSQVKNKPLHSLVIAMRQVLLHDPFTDKLRTYQVTGPLLGDIDIHKIKFICLKCLYRYYLVPEILKRNGIIVEHSLAGWMINSPIIRIPLIGNRFTLVD